MDHDNKYLYVNICKLYLCLTFSSPIVWTSIVKFLSNRTLSEMTYLLIFWDLRLCQSRVHVSYCWQGLAKIKVKRSDCLGQVDLYMLLVAALIFTNQYMIQYNNVISGPCHCRVQDWLHLENWPKLFDMTRLFLEKQ